MYALRLLTFLRPYKKRVALAFFALVGASGFVLAIPLLIRWAINFGLGVRLEAGELVTHGNTRTLVIAAVAIVGAATLRGGSTFLQTYLGEWISQRVAYDVRNRIYDRLQRLSFAYHDRQQTGQLMSRATQDVEAVRWFIHMGVLRAGYIFLLLIAILILMAVTNWKLTLVAWAFLPLIAWRSTVMALTLRPLWMKIQEGLARLTTGDVILSRTVKTIGIGEGHLDEMVSPLLKSENPTVGVYAKPDGVHLRLTAKASTQEAARRLIQPMEEELRRLVGDAVWGVDDDSGIVNRQGEHWRQCNANASWKLTFARCFITPTSHYQSQAGTKPRSESHRCRDQCRR